MHKLFKIIVFLLSILGLASAELWGATYYSNTASGRIANTLANWSLNADGSGGAPATWDHTFIIQSADSMVLNATWGDGSASMNVTINSGATLNLNGNTLSSVMNLLTINGNRNAYSGAINNSSATAATIQEDIVLGSNSSLTAELGNISISGNITTAGFEALFNGAEDFTISGIISGSGSVYRTGAGDLALSAANTFSGLTTINSNTGGSISISNASALGTTDAGVIITTGSLNISTNLTVLGETVTIL